VSNGNSSSDTGDTNGSKTCSVGWLDWFTSYTVWVNATDGNLSTNESFVFTTKNMTVGNITVSNPFPGNGSVDAPIQPYLYVSLNHTLGETMNISWYYGTSQGAENTLLGSDVNITNGTVDELCYQASSYNTVYYWRVMVNDGEGLWVNDTFSFTTDSNITMISRGANVGIVGAIGIFGILGFVLVLMVNDKKKKYYRR
jgi:hypothetical protein